MTPEVAVDLIRDALWLTAVIVGLVVLPSLVVGLIVAMFQAATQINEMTLSFVPKLVAIFVTLVLAGPWMITVLTDFMRRLFESIPSMIG